MKFLIYLYLTSKDSVITNSGPSVIAGSNTNSGPSAISGSNSNSGPSAKDGINSNTQSVAPTVNEGYKTDAPPEEEGYNKISVNEGKHRSKI